MGPGLFNISLYPNLHVTKFYASRWYYCIAAHGMVFTQRSGLSTYMQVLNSGCFISLKVRGLTYMRIALYAGI